MTKMLFAVILLSLNVYFVLTTTSIWWRIYDGLLALLLFIGIYCVVRTAWDKRKENS